MTNMSLPLVEWEVALVVVACGAFGSRLLRLESRQLPIQPSQNYVCTA